jgi:hypothetical protein
MALSIPESEPIQNTLQGNVFFNQETTAKPG